MGTILRPSREMFRSCSSMASVLGTSYKLLAGLGGPAPLFPYCSPCDLLGWLCLLLVAFLGLVFLASPVSLGLFLHSCSFMYYSLWLYYSSGNYSPANSTLPGLLGSFLTPWSLRFAISMSVKPAQHQVENTGSVLTLTVPSAWAVGCAETNLGNQCLRPCD